MVRHSPPQPVFVVGMQRSGTTALGLEISDAVSRIGGRFTVNGKLMYYLYHWRREDAQDRHFRSDEIVHALRRKQPLGMGCDSWVDDAEPVLSDFAARCAVEPEGTAAAETIADLVWSSYGRPQVWGDKYNEYLLILPFLNEIFPRATWVFVWRHPIEVAGSILRWQGKPWNPTTISDACDKWAFWNSKWLNFRDEIDPARRIECSYDHLVVGASRLTERLALLGLEITGARFRRAAREPYSDEMTPAARLTFDRLSGLAS